jgi:Mg/Co/Ni transporter MgtE
MVFSAARTAVRTAAPMGARMKSFSAGEAWHLAHKEIAVGTGLGVVCGVVWLAGAALNQGNQIEHWLTTHNSDLSAKKN